ncbi:MAG: helix-hairpin-helix domain-containing protein [Flavobacteriales bacterium]
MSYGNPFDISIRHQRGIWLLIIASLLIIFAPRMLLLMNTHEVHAKLILLPEEKRNDHPYKRYWNKKRNPYKRWRKKEKHRTIPAHTFDPNELSKEEWQSFGLTEKQAEVVLKMTKRGIHSNEELQQIKFIPKDVFENIKKFTKYPEKSTSIAIAPSTDHNQIQIDLNHTDEKTLIEMNGLGPFYAKQILKYQQQLGGFIRKEQLLEVWKMTPEIYEKVKDQFTCTSDDVRKISINHASAEELQAHPYLNWNQANSIVKMRLQRGGFHSIQEIKESVIIDQETFEKVRPYLSL